jgi:hypothetical protein
VILLTILNLNGIGLTNFLVAIYAIAYLIATAGPVFSYDVFANKNEWIIVSIDGKPVDRAHGTWPLMKGALPGD